MTETIQIAYAMPSGGEGSSTLEEIVQALPRQKQLLLSFNTQTGKFVANVAGSSVAQGDSVQEAVGAAYAGFLKTVQIDNPFRKQDPSYVAPAPRQRVLVGDTIPKSSLMGAPAK